MTLRNLLTALAAIALVTASTGRATTQETAQDDAGEETREKVREIQIQKIVTGDCDDCEKGAYVVRKIVVGEDGEMRELEGDDPVWVDGDAKVHVVRLGKHGHPLGGKGGFLGVRLAEMTTELREHFGAPRESGVLVSKVVDDSPAARAGIQVGDVISAVDGEPVASPSELAHAVRGYDDGATAVLEVWRAGKLETLSATIEEREGAHLAWSHSPEGRAYRVAHLKDGHRSHRIRVKCSDEDDCDVDVDSGIDLGEFDCGDADECRVQVRCEDDACDCTVNGEATDCEQIPGFSERHGE